MIESELISNEVGGKDAIDGVLVTTPLELLGIGVRAWGPLSLFCSEAGPMLPLLPWGGRRPRPGCQPAPRRLRAGHG